MWPGEQPPGGGQNPPDQNPYQQPGYQQQNPHQQSPAPWNAPTVTAGPPAPSPDGGGSRRTKVVAIVAAVAVVVAAGVTGFVLLSDDGDAKAGPGPTKSASPQASSQDTRSNDAEQPTVEGWKVVVNPKRGITFDVPADWELESPSWVTYVSENDDPEDKPLVAMMAPAVLKKKWCGVDEDKDGSVDHTSLASAGTKGNNGAKSAADVARSDSRTWVYGAYTQPEKKNITTGPVSSFTTDSGITGSVATSESSGVKKQDKCDFDGKATTFAFKNAEGDFVSWSFIGVKGVSEEVPDATIRKILATVRLYEDPSAS